MKPILNYLLLISIFIILSAGVLVAGFIDDYAVVGNRMFELLLPMTLIFITGVVVNDKILIPGLLLKGRYGYYCACVFSMVYAMSFGYLGLEYFARLHFDLPMRISDYQSPWIFVSMLCDCLLAGLILLGLGMKQLFNRWNEEVKEEQTLASRLETYISEVNRRLNLTVILDKLQRIYDNVFSAPEATDVRIRELSNHLREQLYELPEPPNITTDEPGDTARTRMPELLVSKRYRPVRHIIILGVLALISCSSFFNAPDNPHFTFDRALGVFSLFGFLVLLAYINILWLYPKFLKQGNIKRYGISVGIMLLAIILPLIVAQILTYEPNVYTKRLPVIITIVSTMSSVLTLFFFVGGISSMLVIQNRVLTEHRMILLKAETVRQEYSWLRKQINPHFLFNVLNNIGICAYDDTELTAALLADLKHLLEYQLLESRKEMTTLQTECAFFKSFFDLERTRRDRFEYSLKCDAPGDVKIPTLLFNPFVENAVKYSSSTDDMPNVVINFAIENGHLKFVCKNHYDPDRIKQMKRGGLGVDNTLKRLKYLYDDKFDYRVLNENNTYTVFLTIPLI